MCGSLMMNSAPRPARRGGRKVPGRGLGPDGIERGGEAITAPSDLLVRNFEAGLAVIRRQLLFGSKPFINLGFAVTETLLRPPGVVLGAAGLPLGGGVGKLGHDAFGGG